MRKALLSYLVVALTAGPALCCCLTRQATEQPDHASPTTVDGCPHCQRTRTEPMGPMPRRQQCPCRQLGQCALLPPAIKPSQKAVELPLPPVYAYAIGMAAFMPQFESIPSGVASHRPFWDPLDFFEKHHRLRC